MFSFVEVDDVTKQKDMSKFHRTLLNQIAAEDGGSGEAKGRARRQEEERGRKVSLGETSAADMQEQSPDREEQEPGDSTFRHENSEYRLGNLGQESTGGERLVADPEVGSRSDSQGRDGDTPELDKRSGEETDVAQCLPAVVDKEERRKMASAKRTNEETLGSAKERYLARKRIKLSAPVISSDD